ncbi:hypothetical protein [Embleya sp. NBC_00896]|uniref:hypothetical protein n=1 Tax=Embleya sp. NBC_00896 TaxID=2975961 RepID=UPI00386CD171|nr:hypothetical protein OG928_34695 [Embleya sp. NBC_00896]
MAKAPRMPGTECLAAFGRQVDLEEALRRDPSGFVEAVRYAPDVPRPLAEAVIAVGGEWIGLLARNFDALAENPDLRRRLAGTGHPLVARAVFENIWGAWLPAELRLLLAAADPADAGWKPRLARIRALTKTRSKDEHERCDAVTVLRATVVAPFPQLVRTALAAPDTLDRAEQLRGLLSLYTHGGSVALRAAVADPEIAHELRRHDGAELAARALADPDGGPEALRDAVATAEGTPGGLTESYVDPWNRLDWPALMAAHADRPLASGLIEGLLTREDCPPEAFASLGAAHPEPLRILEQLRHRPAPAALLEVIRPSGMGMGLDILLATLDRSLGRTVTGDDLLHVVRPASLVLEAAQGVRDPAQRQGREWERFGSRLADLVAESLGADIAAWRMLRSMLKEYPGSVADLVKEAATRTVRERTEHREDGSGSDRSGDDGPPSWPDGRAGVPSLTGPWMVLKKERAAFVALLNAAATPVQRELLRHVDDETASDLLALGEWRPDWTAWARAGEPGGRERVLIARHQMCRQVVVRDQMATGLPSRPLPADAAAELARLDDPAINAALIYQPNLPRDLRDAVLAGVPLGPGAKPGGRLPLSAELRGELLSEPTRWEHLLPVFGTGDTRLTAQCLASGWAERSPTLQLRMLLGLWERNGPELLDREHRRWLPKSVDDDVRSLVTELLSKQDADAALERLRAATTEGESTRGLLTRFRTSGSDLNIIRAEGFELDWEQLYDAFQRGRLDPGRAHELASDDQCLVHLRDRPWVRLNRAQRKAVDALNQGQSPATVLANNPLPARGRGDAGWITEALALTPLTPVDVIRHARPAVAALRAVALEGVVRQELESLVRKHLTGQPAGWALACRLLPDFPGTLPELLSTIASAVVAEPH